MCMVHCDVMMSNPTSCTELLGSTQTRIEPLQIGNEGVWGILGPGGRSCYLNKSFAVFGNKVHQSMLITIILMVFCLKNMDWVDPRLYYTADLNNNGAVTNKQSIKTPVKSKYD